ncbi:hypothetical protein BH09BAC1_BH09BAC1_16640 [soil metagenome]
MQEPRNHYTFFQLIGQVLWSPVTGVIKVLQQANPAFYSLSLMALAFVFVTGFALAIISQMYVFTAKTVLFGVKIGFNALLFACVLGLLTHLVKRIFTTSSIKNDLMVSGLASVALIAQTVLLLILLLLFRDSLINTFVEGPITFSPQVALLFFVVLYGVLFFLNLVQQSLLVSGICASRSWYLAPLIVVATVYISTNVGSWLISVW